MYVIITDQESGAYTGFLEGVPLRYIVSKEQDQRPYVLYRGSGPQEIFRAEIESGSNFDSNLA